jgi:hypothetical protein
MLSLVRGLFKYRDIGAICLCARQKIPSET